MPGTAALKKNIRDTERLLRRSTLPADIQREKERKLAALRHAAAEQAKEQRRRHLAARYKMVRFVEGKKAQRKLARATNIGDEGAVADAKKDCLYIQFFPEDQKYLSLYPSTPTTDSEQLAKRAELREKIFVEHGNEDICLPGMHLAAAAGPAGKSKRKNEEPEEDSEEDQEGGQEESDSEEDQEGEDQNDDDDGEDDQNSDSEAEDSYEDSDVDSEEDDDDWDDSEEEDTDDYDDDEEFSDGDDNGGEDDEEDGSGSDAPNTKKQRR